MSAFVTSRKLICTLIGSRERKSTFRQLQHCLEQYNQWMNKIAVLAGCSLRDDLKKHVDALLLTYQHRGRKVCGLQF